MAKYVILFLVLSVLGYAQARLLAFTRKEMAKQPADVRERNRWRVTHVFPAIMGLVLVLIFAAILLLRSHA